MKFNYVLTALAVLLSVIIGVIMWAFFEDVTSLVCSEVMLLPMLILMMGVSFESSKVTMLIKTYVSIMIFVTVVVNILLGVFDAGIVGNIIFNGLLLFALILGTYLMTRINQ